VIAVFVVDGARADYFTTYAAEMPALSRLRAAGAWFENAYVSSAPTVTAVGHANVGTGAEPRSHGIAVNHRFDQASRKGLETYATLDPAELEAPTLADIWNVSTAGKAVIIGQGGAMRATIGLVGHGGCLPDAQRVIASSYVTAGGWETNSKCYVLSPALASLDASRYWTTERTAWMDHDINSGEAFKPTALFQRFEGDALSAVLEREAIGADDITDLVLINLKATDYVGHAYGPDSPEIRATLRELDTQVQRAVAIFERKAGMDGFVVTLTADHGMPGGNRRHSAKDLAAAIDDRFGAGTVQMLRDGANSEVHVDTSRLAAAGHTLEDIAAFLERDPSVGYIKYAFTEAQVRYAQARLPR
jgi:predicted AlkP superfamily pyrophosphatase or phosphodiesterase